MLRGERLQTGQVEQTFRPRQWAADLLRLAVSFGRVERFARVTELERDAADLAHRHRPVEAGLASGMAGARPVLFHLDPDCVLIAVDPHLGDALGVPGAFALFP